MRRSAIGAVVVVAVGLASCNGAGSTGPSTSMPNPGISNSSSVVSLAATSTPQSGVEDALAPSSAPSVSVVSPTDPTGPIAAPVRNPLSGRSIYFVLVDRFDNGDDANDTAGLDPAAGPLAHGFEPTRTGYHHGGDLAGLTSRLDYIAGMGIGAVWITSPFANRYVQGDGTLEGSSSSYHGYWNVDWTRIDPHLGTNAEMKAFIAAAHERDIAVYFDAVVNHTGDVISYAEGTDVFRPTSQPPYTPVFADPADADAKAPAWLNDTTLYHNRGNSTFSGESDTLGDFYGLDDLATEDPRVVDGFVELYSNIIDEYDIDGFRLDTVKHVNPEFWAEFAPRVRAAAAAAGKPDFVLFGEVYNTDPISQSAYTNLGITSTLDFVIDDALETYVAKQGSGADLAAAFDNDDWFTDSDNNASMQVEFFGNHDIGRMGYQLDVGLLSAGPDELLAAAKLANDLLFLTRGAPVVYYGDEQGFIGDGGDQSARQDMMPTAVPEYAEQAQIGTDATPGDDNFDTSHPLYQHIAALNQLRADHPVFVTGAQVNHPADGPVYAFSRIDRIERVEYVVVANSSSDDAEATISVLSPDTKFNTVRDGDGDGASSDVTVTSGGDGKLSLTVPARSALVLQAAQPLAIPGATPGVQLVRPAAGTEIPTPRYRIEAEVANAPYAEVTFAVAVNGGAPTIIGVDDAAPYRVYWDNSALSAGTEVTISATVWNGSATTATSMVTVTLGARGL